LKEYICEGFKIIQKSHDLNYKQKEAMLENFFSLGAVTGWRAKAITLRALKLFIKIILKNLLV
jgi:hypothetical protein